MRDERLHSQLKIHNSLFIILFFLFGCRSIPPQPTAVPPPTPQPALRIGLTGSVGAMGDLVADAYPSPIQFITGGNAALFEEMENGRLDAILVHHIPATSSHYFNPVALDGIAVIVHPDNPVNDLGWEEMRDIFSGKTAVWNTNQPIALFSREPESGAMALLQERLLQEQPISVNAQIEASNEGMLTAVATNPAAIGYAMMGSLTEEVKALTLNGTPPTPLETASQRYPLSVPLYFVSPTEPTDGLRAFLAWIQSDTGQNIIAEDYGRLR